MLLEEAQKHAAMQRKVAKTTEEMVAAKRELAELESRRHDEQATDLATTKETLGERKEEAQQRAASEDLTREVIDRVKQPSAAQAAKRLADVLQRRS
jgi:hypothetical protein